jgi:hypothetical protein
VRHRQRLLAVSDHAVDRLRERADANYLDAAQVRRLLAEEVARGVPERHYVTGQERVRLTLLGVEVWAVIGVDKTGWSRRHHGSGRAVVTVLTLEQVENRLEEGCR